MNQSEQTHVACALILRCFSNAVCLLVIHRVENSRWKGKQAALRGRVCVLVFNYAKIHALMIRISRFSPNEFDARMALVMRNYVSWL